MQELQKLGPWNNEEIVKGYRSFSVDLSSLRPNVPQIHRGTVHYQNVQIEHGLFHNRKGSTHQLQPTDEPFQMPVFPMGPFPDYSTHNRAQLEKLVEDLLADLANSQDPAPYLVATAHSRDARERLGLPEMPLEASHRLLCTKKHIAGIHSSNACVSQKQSWTAFRKENFLLQSLNILWRGSPQYWVLITPRHTTKFEACFLEHRKGVRAKAPRCSQFIQHFEETPTLSLLREWKVDYSIFIQIPGIGIETDYSTYHYVLNSGPNEAEALNWCDEDWRPPPLYLPCSKNCGSGQSVKLSMKCMMIGLHRPLQIPDDDDLGPISAPVQKSDDNKSNIEDASKSKRDLRASCEDVSDSATCIAESDQDEGQASMPTRNKLHPQSSRTLGPSLKSTLLQQKGQMFTPMRKQNDTDEDTTQGCGKQVEFSTKVSRPAIDIENADPRSTEVTVKDIQRLIRLATENHAHFVWPSGGRDQPKETITHHLARFDPTLTPPANWLDDDVVFEVLWELSSAADDVYVMHPGTIRAAVEMNDLECTRLSTVSANTIIAPYNMESHWCLIVIEIKKKTIIMFEQNSEAVARFLGESVNYYFKTSITWIKQQIPQKYPADGINCAVYLLAHVEDYLVKKLPKDQNQSYPNPSYQNPSSLRLHFLQVLVGPLQQRLFAFDRIQGPTERKRHSDNEIPVVPVKRLYGDIPIRRDTTLVDITNLVSKIGSPKVFADLLLLRPLVSHKASGDITIAMDMFMTGQANTITGKMKERMAGWYIYIRFEGLKIIFEKHLKVAKAARRKKKRNNPTYSSSGQAGWGADTYAIEELVREWQMEKGKSFLTMEELRRRLKKAKDLGKEVDIVYGRCDNRSIDMLVPGEQVEMFYKLDPAQLHEMVASLKSDRPRLWEALPGMTPGLNALFRGDKVRLRLDDLTMGEILKEEQDSDKLLQSLQVIPTSLTYKATEDRGQTPQLEAVEMSGIRNDSTDHPQEDREFWEIPPP